MDNAIINMKLTPQEAVLIENIRSMQGKPQAAYQRLDEELTYTPNDEQSKWESDEQSREELIERYMGMTDEGFIDLYAKTVGDDKILSVLQDTMHVSWKWDTIWDAMNEDVINELFKSYVSVDSKRQLFLNSHTRDYLAAQLVDLIMGGSY